MKVTAVRTSRGILEQIVRTLGHQYWIGDRELLGVTRILESANITDFSAPWFTEWHLRRGQLVHEMVALDVTGALDEDTVGADLSGFLVGFRKFRAEVGGEVEFSEEIVAEDTIGIAGTLDLIIRHPDDHPLRRRLYDVKPGKSAATAIQTAAYARMARALYDRPVSFTRAGLILPGDGNYSLDPFTNAGDEHVFLAAARVAHWRKANAE